MMFLEGQGQGDDAKELQVHLKARLALAEGHRTQVAAALQKARTQRDSSRFCMRQGGFACFFCMVCSHGLYTSVDFLGLVMLGEG